MYRDQGNIICVHLVCAYFKQNPSRPSRAVASNECEDRLTAGMEQTDCGGWTHDDVERDISSTAPCSHEDGPPTHQAGRYSGSFVLNNAGHYKVSRGNRCLRRGRLEAHPLPELAPFASWREFSLELVHVKVSSPVIGAQNRLSIVLCASNVVVSHCTNPILTGSAYPCL